MLITRPAFVIAFALSAFAAVQSPAQAQDKPPIAIVAAENFYGDIASQIGGAHVSVTSILENPDEDPHLFEASAAVGRALSTADIAIENGIDYDPWMEKLLDAAKNPHRKTIVVAELLGKKAGDNPHLWYDLNAIDTFANTLTDELSTRDPTHKAEYQSRLAAFRQSLGPLEDKIKTTRARFAGAPVTATEPVFGYMFDALALVSRNRGFQLAVMNNTEPSASDVAGFETDLSQHRVRLLAYNRQASDPIADRMRKLADESHIPVVGVTETEPTRQNYQAWMTSEVDAVAEALSK
ncbi:MAG TPA: zinc ABC transporter substrate-binding protein [Methylovirgula sp.]|jgi:zinc/manganese transport system substrate-binding protein